MNPALDSLNILPFADNKVAQTQIINSAMLNFMLAVFAQNDDRFKNASEGLYFYGPKTFIKQISSSNGTCDLLKSFEYIGQDVRDGAAGRTYNLSGYCYDKTGYKVWNNTGYMSSEKLLSEVSIDLIKNGYDIKYGSLSSSNRHELSDGQVIPSEPEIYSSIASSDSKYESSYFNKTVNANSYLVTLERDKIPSNWKPQLHLTFDTQPVRDICKAYFEEHQQTSAQFDSMGCATHWSPPDQLFASKIVTSLSNVQPSEDNAFADVMQFYWHGIQTAEFQVSSPALACAATSAKPTDQDGYQLTHKKLNKSYDNLYSMSKSIKGAKVEKQLSCTFMLFSSDINGSAQFDMYIDVPNVTTYIPEISNAKEKSSGDFAKTDIAGEGYSDRNILGLQVFPTLKLKNSVDEIRFVVSTIELSYEGGGLKKSGHKFSGLTNGMNEKDVTQLKPSEQMAVPPYIRNASDCVIVGGINYQSVAFNANSEYGDGEKDSAYNIFQKEKPSYPITGRFEQYQVGSSTGSAPITYTLAVYDGSSNDRSYICQTLNGLGYDYNWTKTRLKFNWKNVVGEAFQMFKKQRSDDKSYEISLNSVIANAKTIASDRFQIGDDTARYVESQILSIDETYMVIEIFNSDNQTLRLTGSIKLSED